MFATTNHHQLRNYMLFKDLSEDALIELASHCQHQTLNVGETLFHQNDQSDALYLLEEGQIHIVRQYPDGEDVILATEMPYYAIGDLSMLVGGGRTAAVVAVSDCTLIKIDRDAFFEICQQVPDVASQVILYLAKRLRDLNLKVREYAISNVAARVASVVLLLSGGDTGEIKSKVRVSRIARAIATDADTVERILRQWQDAGYILFDRGQMQILDLDMIRHIAG